MHDISKRVQRTANRQRSRFPLASAPRLIAELGFRVRNAKSSCPRHSSWRGCMLGYLAGGSQSHSIPETRFSVLGAALHSTYNIKNALRGSSCSSKFDELQRCADVPQRAMFACFALLRRAVFGVSRSSWVSISGLCHLWLFFMRQIRSSISVIRLPMFR